MTLGIPDWISMIFNKSMLHWKWTLTKSLIHWKTSGTSKPIHDLFISSPRMHRTKGSSSYHTSILMSCLQSVRAVRVQVIIRVSLMIVWRIILNHNGCSSIWTTVLHIIGTNILGRLILKVKLSSCLSLGTATTDLLHLLNWLVVVLLRWSCASYLVIQESTILVFYETSSLGNWATLTSWLKSLDWISVCKEWTSYHRLRTIQKSLLLLSSGYWSRLLRRVLYYASNKSLRDLTLWG